MPNTTTTNYGWTIIEVGANADQWGSLNNTNFTDIDADLFAVSTVASAALPKAGGTMTGVIVGATPAAGGAGYASFRFPHGTAPTDNLANGDMWTTTAGAFIRINGATKTLAFTDSSITGNAATATALATGRTIGMTGDVVWTSSAFDGTGNVTGTAEIQAGVITATELANNAVTTAKITDNNVTLAKIETIANNTVLGNVSGGAAVPAALTATQVTNLIDETLLDASTMLAGTKLLNNDGYIKLPGGLYIMWGTQNFGALATQATAVITFPVEFPNACHVVVPTLISDTTVHAASVQVRSITTTGATVALNEWTTASASFEISYIAIGY